MAKKKKDSPTKKTIFIVGESPLVEEYAELCASHGYAVKVRWNVSPKSQPKFGKLDIRPTSRPTARVSFALELTVIDLDRKQKNLRELGKYLPVSVPILSSSVSLAVAEQSPWVLHPERLIGTSAFPSFAKSRLMEFAPSLRTSKEHLSIAQEFCVSLRKEVSVVQDRLGMVLPRILCALVNEAYFALQENISTPQDIDLAMKLGTNYPLGPVEWGEKIGISFIYAVLSGLQNDLGEDRYRVAPLLKQMALSGKWWRQPSQPGH